MLFAFQSHCHPSSRLHINKSLLPSQHLLPPLESWIPHCGKCLQCLWLRQCLLDWYLINLVDYNNNCPHWSIDMPRSELWLAEICRYVCLHVWHHHHREQNHQVREYFGMKYFHLPINIVGSECWTSLHLSASPLACSSLQSSSSTVDTLASSGPP